MKISTVMATDDYAEFPAIAAALLAIEQAGDAGAASTARDALRRAELERDIALGFTDLWGQWEHEQAAAMGLLVQP